MNEKDTKKLVKQSLIETSEDFTSQLMHKIEQQQATTPVKVNWWPGIAACLAVALLGFLLTRVAWENVYLEGPLKRVFQAFLSFFLIFSSYRFYVLKKSYRT